MVELPKDWWPNSWFHDIERTKPVYRRPAVPLRFAIPGHPKSGNIWEGHTDEIFVNKVKGWRKIEGWNSIWLHEDGSIMLICVYDFLLCSPPCIYEETLACVGTAH